MAGQKEERLFVAIENGEMTLVKRLVLKHLFSRSADVNARTDFGSTPLHLAVMNNHPDIAKLLIQSGAEINATDADGKTPLHIASAKNHMDFLKVLLLKGADLEIKDRESKTPLDLAVSNRNIEIIRVLVKKGAALNHQESLGRYPGSTMLHRMIMDHYLEGVKFFLENGADIKIKDRNGKTPVDYAMASSPQISQLMRDHLKKNQVS
jgi:ankyrin repeat protein